MFKVIEFQKLESSKVCLFAHFDSAAQIRDYILFHIESLRKTGFQIILISTSNLSDSEIQKLKSIVSVVIIRENIGYDFGSWVTGYKYLKEKYIPEELILTNDSVYGPFSDLRKILEEMKLRKLDFWGLTDSYEVQYHIQSYFLWISGNVLRSKLWENWIESFFYYRAEFKSLIVRKYEIGISRMLFRTEFKTGAYINYFDLLDQMKLEEIARRNLNSNYENPTLNLWDILILKNNFPYLKRNLISINGIRSFERISWKKILFKFKNIIPMIEKDLKES